MRNLAIYLSALATLSPALGIKHGAAQFRDLLAYPKYDVQFLNDLPISSGDAGRAESLGVETEDEWTRLHLNLHERKRLSDGSDVVPDADRLRILPMSLTPPGALDPADYLCLMPHPKSIENQTARADLHEQVDLDPVQSWAALAHLDGKCLYTDQGWFTYSYCHNSHVRQFRRLRHRSHGPGGYEPEEDTSYDAYTLGQAYHQPASKRQSGKTKSKALKANHEHPNSVSDPSSHSHSHSVSFAQSAASRYLVQRWSDGTTCDKTGRPREVEVQIHCSMTTTDIIYLVKEMAICQYVVIIHSPHLCGLPGFRAPHADVQPAGIRCRQVISDEDFDHWTNGQTEQEDTADFRSPWKMIRPTGGGDEVSFAWDGIEQAGEEKLSEEHKEHKEHKDHQDIVVEETIDLGELVIDDAEFQAILLDALTSHGRGGDDVDEDGFVMLALEEDEEGNIVLDSTGSEGSKGKDREMLLRAVRQFLETKGVDLGSRDESGEREETGEDAAQASEAEHGGHDEL